MTPTPDDPPLFDADGALSRAFLLRRGFCCGNGCRNCPYGCVAGCTEPLEPRREAENEPARPASQEKGRAG